MASSPAEGKKKERDQLKRGAQPERELSLQRRVSWHTYIWWAWLVIVNVRQESCTYSIMILLVSCLKLAFAHSASIGNSTVDSPARIWIATLLLAILADWFIALLLSYSLALVTTPLIIARHRLLRDHVHCSCRTQH